MPRLEERLEELAEAHGARVAIVGQSRGGVLPRRSPRGGPTS